MLVFVHSKVSSKHFLLVIENRGFYSCNFETNQNKSIVAVNEVVIFY